MKTSAGRSAPEVVDGQVALARPGLVDACASLWVRAFAGAPWHAHDAQRAERIAAIRSQLAHPGARVALVAGGPVGPVGVGWTWPGDRAPDDDLHHAVRAAVGPVTTARLWRPDVRVLVELMVDPSHQGRGTGAALLETLVGEADGWLLTHPEGAGIGLYERTGWREVGQLDRRGTPLTVMARLRAPADGS